MTAVQDAPVTVPPVPRAGRPTVGRIKCVVWDLDHTLWDGVLLEDGTVTVRPEVVAHVHRLDAMGILNSIASKNDPDAVAQRLAEAGLTDMFLAPQVGWGAKSESLKRLADILNLGLEAFAFVDDQEFERAEVAFALPAVTVVDVAELEQAMARPEFRPRFVTDESARRRIMYLGQLARDETQREFVGTSDEFLAGLELSFRIESARREDLQRAEELTVRTNQLNSTGRTYSYDELDVLRESPTHRLLVASLTDRFGSYGKIGLALLEQTPAGPGDAEPLWHLRMMLMSCRVMSRGVGMVLLNHILGLAAEAGARVRADFVETGRNRMMQITYAFAGFREVARDGDRLVLEADLSVRQPPPAYVRLEVAA